MAYLILCKTTGTGTNQYNWDISSASYSGNSLDIIEEGSPLGLTFSPDGNNIYVTRQAGIYHDITQFSLSIPWDITSTYSQVNNTVLSGVDTPTSILFNSDGSKVYVYDNISNKLYEYPLSTPWMISSIGTSSDSFTLSGITNPNIPSVALSTDGTKLFALDRTSGAVHSYTLSTAWDLSSASYDSGITLSVPQEGNQLSIKFRGDGGKMYITGSTSDNVYQYSLLTPWDLSTGSYDSVFVDVSSQATVPGEVEFNQSGSQMFVLDVGVSPAKLFEYTL